MPKDTSTKGRHPLVVKGDVNAGMLFVQMLQEVVVPVRINRKGLKGRASTPKPAKQLLQNRGFSLEVRGQIVAGELAVSEDAIRQLLFDFYVAFPKRVRDGAREYLMLKSIVDGNWEEFPELSRPKKVRKRAKVMPQLHELFTTGDPDLGRWFVQTISEFRSEKKRVKLHHQIGDARLEKIGAGELPLPREVFLDVMQRLVAHFEMYSKDVVPRSFIKLQRFAVEQKLMKGADNG